MAEVARPTHAEIMDAVADVREELRKMKKIQVENADKLDKVVEKQATMTEMVQTWDTFKTGGKVITSFSKFAAAVLVLIALFKTGLVGFWEGGK